MSDNTPDPQTPDSPGAAHQSVVEAALEKTKRYYDPESDPSAQPGPGEGEPGEPKEQKAEPPEKGGEEKPEEKPTEKKETKEGEEKPEEKKGLEEPPDKTDKRVADAQRMAHQKAQEAADLKKQLDEERQEKMALLQQIEERAAEISEEDEAKIMETSLKEMQEVDPEDAEYLSKMSKIWAKTLREFRKLDAKANKKAAKQVVDEALKTSREENQKEMDEKRLWEKANQSAIEAGLEMEDEGFDEGTGAPVRSDDYRLFWHLFAPQAPANLDQEAKIKWIIKEVKAFNKRKGKTTPTDDKVTKKQLENQPLQRGGAGPGATQEEEPQGPRSFERILKKHRERQTI